MAKFGRFGTQFGKLYTGKIEKMHFFSEKSVKFAILTRKGCILIGHLLGNVVPYVKRYITESGGQPAKFTSRNVSTINLESLVQAAQRVRRATCPTYKSKRGQIYQATAKVCFNFTAYRRGCQEDEDDVFSFDDLTLLSRKIRRNYR